MPRDSFAHTRLSEIKKQLSFRYDGFFHVFSQLEGLGREYYRIVETGCCRKVVGDGIVYGDPVPEDHPWYPGGSQGPWADGQSTYLFDEFISKRRGHVYTVDLNQESCDICRANTSSNVTVICGDSVDVLNRIDDFLGPEKSIDLLYLDSYDLDWDAPHLSALHHLKEMISVSRFLRSGSIVAVDDNLNHGRRGKGLYLAEYMRDIGARLIFDGYQTVWIMNR